MTMNNNKVFKNAFRSFKIFNKHTQVIKKPITSYNKRADGRKEKL